MPFDGLLLDVLSDKSVAGCEPAAKSTDHHSVSSVAWPNFLPSFSYTTKLWNGCKDPMGGPVVGLAGWFNCSKTTLSHQRRGREMSSIESSRRH